MCEECYHTPHLFGCPDAPDDGVCCAACGRMGDAEDMIYADGDYFCEACTDDFDMDDLLSVYGVATVSELIRTLLS